MRDGRVSQRGLRVKHFMRRNMSTTKGANVLKWHTWKRVGEQIANSLWSCRRREWFDCDGSHRATRRLREEWETLHTRSILPTREPTQGGPPSSRTQPPRWGAARWWQREYWWTPVCCVNICTQKIALVVDHGPNEMCRYEAWLFVVVVLVWKVGIFRLCCSVGCGGVGGCVSVPWNYLVVCWCYLKNPLVAQNPSLIILF